MFTDLLASTDWFTGKILLLPKNFKQFTLKNGLYGAHVITYCSFVIVWQQYDVQWPSSTII